MADFLHDDIVWNVLARLPAKSLLRFRCVSTQWNCMVSDPNFIKFRSRKTIILPILRTLHLVDFNVPIDDVPSSVVKHCCPLNHLLPGFSNPKVMGTFNGIVVLSYSRNLILYNPFTCAFNELPYPYGVRASGAFGLGHGVNLDVPKLVMFRDDFTLCDVFNFKERSWNSFSTSKNRILVNNLHHAAGHFLNGFLYWIERNKKVLIVLNIDSMVLSMMNLPFNDHDRLGTMNGCLCALNRFNMWVMKKHNEWSKIYSFILPVNRPLCILGSGRILMQSLSSKLVIYDPGTKMCNELNISLPRYMFDCLEYEESLVSPLDICSK